MRSITTTSVRFFALVLAFALTAMSCSAPEPAASPIEFAAQRTRLAPTVVAEVGLIATLANKTGNHHQWRLLTSAASAQQRERNGVPCGPFERRQWRLVSSLFRDGFKGGTPSGGCSPACRVFRCSGAACQFQYHRRHRAAKLERSHGLIRPGRLSPCYQASREWFRMTW